VHKKEHRHFWQVLLQRVEAVTVICCVLDSIMRADLENVNQHADLLEDGRALRREVRVHEGILTAAVPEVEDKVAEETDVVLLDIDGRAEARGKGSGIVRTVQIGLSALMTRASEGAGTHKMRERMEVFPLPDAPMRIT